MRGAIRSAAVQKKPVVLRGLSVKTNGGTHGGNVTVRTVSGRSFLARILHDRTIDNVIEGVVLTFSDVTPLKKTLQDLTAHPSGLPSQEGMSAT